MYRRIYRFLAGYITISMEGFSPERFLNLCQMNQIELWGIRYTGKSYECCMYRRDFKKLFPYRRKSRIRIRIIKKTGLPFYVFRYRKRKLYFAGVACFFVILFWCSLYIWDIELEGNLKYSDDTLYEFLESEQLYTGILKSKVDCDDIEQKLRIEFREITWVSAELKGTRLIINIKENDKILDVEEKEETPCDLVAETAGVVDEIITQSGIPLVKKGDSVEKGQILVSGAVPIVNDSGETTHFQLVHAQADIKLLTDISYEDEFSMLKEEKYYTGRTKSGFGVSLAGHRFFLPLYRAPFEREDVVRTSVQLRLTDSFYLPVTVEKTKRREYVPYTRYMTKQEAKEDAAHKLDEYFEKIVQKGVQIIENNVRIEISGGKCLAQGSVRAKVPAGTEKPISQPQEETGLQDPE